MAKRRRSSRKRSSGKRRRRSFPAFLRGIRRRRRSNGGGGRRRRSGGRRRRGGAFGVIRGGRGLAGGVMGSIVPVAKVSIGVGAGMVGAALVAQALKKRFAWAASSPAKTGAAVAGIALLVAILARRASPGAARFASLAAVGAVTDGIFRVTASARSRNQLSAALNTGREGILSDVPIRRAGLPPGIEESTGRVTSSDVLAAIA